MVLQTVVEQCLTGLGYELVDLEHGPGGLLRVYIDFPVGAMASGVADEAAQVMPAAADSVVAASAPGSSAAGDAAAAAVAEAPLIRIEDCERVSHQLTHLLTVEQIEYSRLEVSSPGLDRPLRKQADFERFAGWNVTVRLKRPFEGRRNFEGLLSLEGDGKFGIEFSDQPVAAKVAGGVSRSSPKRPAVGAVAVKQSGKGSGKGSGKNAPPATHKMVFVLDEIDKARLVPVVKF